MDRKHASLFVIVALTFAACRTSAPVASTAPDAEASRTLSRQSADAVLWQNTSAEAYWLYRQAYEFASLKLAFLLEDIEEEKQMLDSAAQDRRPLAVIVDIDETVLDNSPYQVNAVRQGKNFDSKEWKSWTDKATAKASPGALDFLRDARDSGCEVFYLSNRDQSEKATTLKNLQDIGFPFADEQHLMLMEGTSDKTARRAKVRSTHRVVLLVGDQLRDYDERFKERSTNYGRNVVDALSDSLSEQFILLPNPMYGTYRDALQGKGTDAEKLARMKAWFEANGY